MKQNSVGEKYMAENVIIYKIEYMSDDDTLHILYYNKEYKCLKKIPLLMIKNIVELKISRYIQSWPYVLFTLGVTLRFLTIGDIVSPTVKDGEKVLDQPLVIV